MNYRHVYHAGNFADCFKHTLLVWLLQAMMAKPKPLLVLDTHAGIGRYNLHADEAQRTGEWRAGIGRLLENPPEALAPYLAIVEKLGLYPGSPAIIQSLLRPGDRLICCEKHPDDFASLRRTLGRAPQTALHERDGYEGLKAFLPPPERRALVLIDPPYEAVDEYDQLLAGLRAALAKFPSAVLAVWYPIKHRAPVRAFHDALRTNHTPDVVAAEIWLRPPLDAARLNGCGLLVINPPYRFEAEAPVLLETLVSRLATEPGAGSEILRLTQESGA